MGVDPLSPKELRATCNAALAVIESLINDHPDLGDDQAEAAEDAQIRLQAIVDATEKEDQNNASLA